MLFKLPIRTSDPVPGDRGRADGVGREELAIAFVLAFGRQGSQSVTGLGSGDRQTVGVV